MPKQNNQFAKKVLYVFIGFSFCSFAFAQNLTKDVQSPNARVERVVNGLLPSFVTVDTKAMNLIERMAFYKVPGLSVAVIDNGQIAWSQEFGVPNAQTKTSVNAETIFQAASISKPVSAFGAMRMVEMGQLNLDDDVNLVLRSWKVPLSVLTATEKVTLRRLLSHSAGLTVSGFPGYALGAEVPTAKQILEGTPPANTAAVKVFYTPQSKVEYSGGGFTVVQQLMMDARNIPFDQLMADLVLNPIGMRNSTFMQPLAISLQNNAAAGHNSRAETITGLFRTHPELAAAGLWTTSADLARFAITLQNAQRLQVSANQSESVSSANLLSPSLAREMLTVQSWPYGLGFVIEGEGSTSRFSHRGSNAGFQCILVGFKNQGSGVVILTNGDNGNGLIQELIRAVATEYQWPALAPKRYDVKVLAPAQQAQFVGYFKNKLGQQLRVRQHEGQLIGQSSDGWAALAWLGNELFTAVDQQTEMSFIRDTQNNVVGASVVKDNRPTEAFEKMAEPPLSLELVPIFLRGNVNGWGMNNPMSKVAPDTFATRIELSAGFAEFKIANQNYDEIDLGVLPNSKPGKQGESIVLVPKGANIQLVVDKAGVYEVTLIAKPRTDLAFSVRLLD
jgi:CubicO group peptidase (beta-lactamase class C family)